MFDNIFLNNNLNNTDSELDKIIQMHLSLYTKYFQYHFCIDSDVEFVVEQTKLFWGLHR